MGGVQVCLSLELCWQSFAFIALAGLWEMLPHKYTRSFAFMVIKLAAQLSPTQVSERVAAHNLQCASKIQFINARMN